MIATGLGQVAASGNAQLDTQVLEQDRHEVRNHDDRKERVAKLRAARQVGRPVARIHVADRDQKSRAGESD